MLTPIAAMLLLSAEPVETAEADAETSATVERASTDSQEEPQICRSIEVIDYRAMRGRKTTKLCKTREEWKAYSRRR